MSAHLSDAALLAFKRGQANNLGAVRWSTHLSLCATCLRRARAQMPLAGEVPVHPAASALAHLSVPRERWSTFPDAHRDALRFVDERPLGFAFLVVEEAFALAEKRLTLSPFDFTATLVESILRRRSGAGSQLLRARNLLRRGEAEARLGRIEKARETLRLAQEACAGLELDDEIRHLRDAVSPPSLTRSS